MPTPQPQQAPPSGASSSTSATPTPAAPSAGAALRSNARGADFAGGEAMLAPQGGASGQLGLARGTQVEPAVRASYRSALQTGVTLLAADAFEAAVPVFSGVYALPNLPANARFKALYNLAFAHIGANRSPVALGLLREAQALPGVAAALRGVGDGLVAWAHERMQSARGQATGVGGNDLRPALEGAFEQAVAAFTAGQFQAAHDGFMRIFSDARALVRFPNLRAAAAVNAGVSLKSLGRAAEGVRMIEDALSVSGIGNITRLGAFDAMRACQLAASQRTEGGGSGASRAGVNQLFDDAAAAVSGGQYARALTLFMEIYSGPFWSRVDPDSRGAYVFNIAVCHQRLGDKEEALTWYQNALDRHGFADRAGTADAMRRLRLADAGQVAASTPSAVAVRPPRNTEATTEASAQPSPSMVRPGPDAPAPTDRAPAASNRPTPLGQDTGDFETLAA